uniref:Uncharacterized protein n=1 Tax=Glossina pallidipes TaxID=7398 RepID=A0A1A9ZXB6_GLOPL
MNKFTLLRIISTSEHIWQTHGYHHHHRCRHHYFSDIVVSNQIANGGSYKARVTSTLIRTTTGFTIRTVVICRFPGKGSLGVTLAVPFLKAYSKNETNALYFYLNFVKGLLLFISHLLNDKQASPDFDKGLWLT